MAEASTRGTTAIWVAVAAMLTGFAVGGIGLILGSWLVMGIGTVVFVLAGLYGLANGIMEQVH